MICPKCGSETHRFDNVMYACDKCDWIRHADEVINTLSERAEKAEGELKAIKARIEKINIDDICEITHHLIETLDTAESITLDEKIFNFIKQIGGEK